MKLCVMLTVALVVMNGAFAAPFSTNGNRLAYLDSDDPFYPNRDFPKLTTPQWVGEEGVDAVVILSIDDMRETPKYETMLRPILERLKKIDGRAPVSILANAPLAGRSYTDANSADAKQIQSWLKEGLSIECHTISHPCPLCQKGDFKFAFTNFHDCVDLMSSIPGNKPVAFRMPCCDSMNSPSPRFYSEIFNRTSPKGNFLGIDSSVMVVLTTNDPSLPRELVMDADGRERFRKYLPSETNATTRVSMGSFTTTIEDYPYPYVIGKLCWEFPCIVPSDWEANNLHKPNNPKTVEDWQRALDAIVIKQGVMTVVFHPHGWIKPEQMVEFIDYAVTKYGKRVKFLNFKEAEERLTRSVFPLRIPDATWSVSAAAGKSTGVGGQLVDVNNDGYLDILNWFAGHDLGHAIKIWDPMRGRWETQLVPPGYSSNFNALHWGVVRSEVVGISSSTSWRFLADRPQEDRRLIATLPEFPKGAVSKPLFRLRDFDRDDSCELVVESAGTNAIYKWDSNGWRKLDYALPPATSIVNAQGRDAGLRFVDVDEDGYDDVLFSNHERYSLHLFRKDARNLRLKPGWSDEIVSGPRVNALTDPIPPIVRDGPNRNNGVWFKNDTMWIQNEDTAHLPDKVDRRTFKQLLDSGTPRPLSPEESLKAMRAPAGFKVELVASEPLIRDPIAFEWAADGRLWVLEMSDYPLGVDGKGAPGGRLQILEDTDGDGRYDKATTFFDQLSCPEGMHPWRNGAVVIAAKDLFYAEDTNGDGKADVREVLFTGFSEGNQQHRANGFSYGLDGWLYGANGESDGMVRAAGFTSLSPLRGEGAERNQVTPLPNPLPSEGRGNLSAWSINIRGQDFRFDPDRRLLEAIGGRTQYGLNRDDFGNWFGNNNSTWLWHHAFPVPYLTRNPQLPLKTTKKMLANYAGASRCFPISKTLSRFNDPFAFNHVTSANSAIPYRDELFGKDFASSVFISEPVHNLVHREVLEPDGVSFKSRRAAGETNSEFLASSDNWFRPTMIKTGPDGALYVADMYRLVIEHPEWIPAEMQARLDLRAGSDKGRIFRVLPKGATLRKIPNLAKMSSAEVAAALDSPNGWQRDTAQRVLLERGDKSVAGKLESLAKEAKEAKVRIQALWTLAGLNALSSELLLIAMKDSSDAVKEQAVKLSEAVLARVVAPHPGPLPRGEGERQPAPGRTGDAGQVRAAANVSPSPGGEGRGEGARAVQLTETLLSFTNATPRLRYQLAFTLGEWNDPRAADALLRLARDDDENVRNAAASSAPRHATTLLAAVEKLPSSDRAYALLPMLKKLVANPPALAKATSIIEHTNVISAEQRAERAKVLARYADVPKLRGDAKNGAALFKLNCVQCHRANGEGADVGPDLGMMSGKPAEQLVEAILNPNAAVEARYQNFSATLKNGDESGGIIISETPTTLTLRAANRADETILRADLKELSTSGLSLMPDGLESAFTTQQLADLIAFVTGK